MQATQSLPVTRDASAPSRINMRVGHFFCSVSVLALKRTYAVVTHGADTFRRIAALPWLLARIDYGALLSGT